MKLIKGLIKQIYEKLLLRSSPEKRIRYLRKQGVKIGENCLINTMQFSTEPYLIEIGNRTIIASDTEFFTHDGSVHCFRDEFDGIVCGKIKIGNNVFIGAKSIILMNTTIGDNCIVGAGSVVRGNFPDNSVIMGNPAKVVSNFHIQKLIFRNSKGYLNTTNLSPSEKERLIKKHFGVE
ncbi:Hexapeptide repeat of succinyl-transferase [Tangfeifania diversioriginum]|uniref:Hexapeptide repeat of succinyl-transferase n=1 Tax=Tangfeifania diversioriginum TaxID=1168035 RepID=A0A1M6GSE0_9BACT|nr:acyltransferase [Tangfeifania diversioriginum]SHJ12819.1 Hexapeptide repeat of succinyl-transferase [Tangfeifania diversioriginum]